MNRWAIAQAFGAGMRKSKRALAKLVFISILLSGTVWADEFSYVFNGTLNSSVNGTTSVAGTFTVDSATGNLTAYNFVLGSFTFTPSDSTPATQVFSGEVLYAIQTPFCNGVGSSCADVSLDFQSAPDFSSLTFQVLGTGRSAVCFATTSSATVANCGGTTGQQLSSFSSGNVSPVPEPSSLFLLGTGLIGGIGVTRRRFPK